MWLFITGHTVHQINLYDYETARVSKITINCVLGKVISLLMLFCHGLILKVNKFCSKVLYDKQVTNAKVRSIFLDGRVEISNNCGEREIKAFVMGLKNWIFSNISKGVTASTVIYSVIETTKANALS